MLEKIINLQEILNKVYYKHKEIWGLTPIDSKYNKIAKESMLEFGKQLLELAAENARIIDENYPEYKYESRCIVHKCDDDEDLIIDKQSILDTIKQVE